MNPHSAGIDIGASFHVVAIPTDLADENVKSFNAFTTDLTDMANWLVKHGITTAAMESTVVYWVPVFEVLQYHGIEEILCNAR